MKFSDRFFSFPIRVYDAVSIKRVTKKQMEDDSDDVIVPAYIKGRMKIPYSALTNIYYHQSFKVGKTPQEVREGGEDGFDMTAIMHPDMGEFECTWKMSKFEEEMDIFAEKYEAFLEQTFKDDIEKPKTEEIQGS